MPFYPPYLLRFQDLFHLPRAGVGTQHLVDDDADVRHRYTSVAVGVGTIFREAAGVRQLQDTVHYHSDIGHGDVAVTVGIAPDALRNWNVLCRIDANIVEIEGNVVRSVF